MGIMKFMMHFLLINTIHYPFLSVDQYITNSFKCIKLNLIVSQSLYGCTTIFYDCENLHLF